VDPSVQAQAVLGIGRGGLVLTIFGAGWLAWGLSMVNAFTLTLAVLFSTVEIGPYCVFRRSDYTKTVLDLA
jgi:hypothetical protein